MAETLKKRNPSIDLMRFIGLTMIILAHIGLSRSSSLLFQLRSFDVPLMVFTYGLAFSGRSTGPYFSFISKRTLRLVLPVYIFVSLYHCTTAFVALGLPVDDPFWSDPYAPWTGKKVWAGEMVAGDHAIKN